MKSALVLLLFSTSLFAQSKPAQTAKPTPEKIITVGDRAVHTFEDGKGSPTVVFEAGMGDTLNTWSRVLPDVARFAHVFAYDRAGSGQSSPGSGERSYAQLAKELHQTLEAQSIAPPYVLVGHSFGAVIVRAFAAAYPKEVSGVVFIDPMTDLALTAAEQAPDTRLGSAPAGVQTEFGFLQQDSTKHFAVMKAIPKPDVPMTLLVARSARPEGWVKAVLDRYSPWIMEREDSSMTVTSNSSQFIQFEEPELVTLSVRRMLFPNLAIRLRRTLRDKGADATIAEFRTLAPQYPQKEVTASVLNALGYSELRQGRVDSALRIFSANAEFYPQDANAFDSLGEAYLAKGDKEKALANYRKSFALDPKNLGAAEAIIKLGGKP